MIAVMVSGGLGNQMFQYALYRRLKEEGKETKLDINWFSSKRCNRPFLLPEVFGINPDIISFRDARKLGARSDYRIIRMLEYRLGFNKDKFVVRNSCACLFEPTVEVALQSGKNIYLDGYWQNEKWFIDVKDIIKSDFIFKMPLDDERQSLLERLNAPNAVAMHIRSYASEEGYSAWQKPTEYYESAMRFVSEKIKNPVYFVFSDDVEWCKNNFDFPDSVYISSSSDSPKGTDMRLMSCCPNLIISNSTYSWWSAYLNPMGLSKTIVTPKRWIPEFGCATPNLEWWNEI